MYYLPGKQNVTVQLTLFNFQSRFQTQYNLLFMNILLVTIPPLIVFNRQIVAGMTAGGQRLTAQVVLNTIRKSFGAVDVIKVINLTVKHGSFTVSVGPSGCGKSTVLRIIAGLKVQTSGALLIDGRDVSGAEPSERGIAMVFQSHALYPHLTVRENIGFGLSRAARPKAEIAARSRRPPPPCNCPPAGSQAQGPLRWSAPARCQ